MFDNNPEKIMRKIFWCLLLWPWVLWANEEASPFAKLQWSGWVSKAWMQTDPEPLRLPQQEDEGWEAALRLDWGHAAVAFLPGFVCLPAVSE